MIADIYDITVVVASVLCMALWYLAIVGVGIKMAGANGRYRLLAMLLLLTVIFSIQATGFLFNAFQFIDAGGGHDQSWQLRLGHIWARLTSIGGAIVVLWFGRPGNPPPEPVIPGKVILPRQEVDIATLSNPMSIEESTPSS